MRAELPTGPIQRRLPLDGVLHPIDQSVPVDMMTMMVMMVMMMTTDMTLEGAEIDLTIRIETFRPPLPSPPSPSPPSPSSPTRFGYP